MGRGIRDGRPSPAIVVAVIALVAALAGTAIAADPLATTSAKKPTKKEVKKIADKRIDKRLPVGTEDIGDGAVTEEKLANGVAISGPPGSARAYARVLTGSVDCGPISPGTACALSQRKGITSVVRGSVAGTYCVRAPGLSPTSLPAFAAVDFGSSVTGATLTVLVDERSPSPFCAADRFAVLTYADFNNADDPTLRGDIAFTILIP